MLAVVLDTNIFISSLLKGKTSGIVVEAFLTSRFQLIISEELLIELDVSARKPRLARFIPTSDLLTLLKLLTKKAKIVKTITPIAICRDPEDNRILECGLAGGADVIVTRDNDLLILSEFQGIEIAPPAVFIERLKRARF